MMLLPDRARSKSRRCSTFAVARAVEQLEPRRLFAVNVTQPFPDLSNQTGSTSVDLTTRFTSTVASGSAVRFNIGWGQTTPQTRVVDIALYDKVTPLSAANILAYVNAGRYTNMFFHRSVPGFVLQGGGFNWVNNQVGQVQTNPNLQNEFTTSPRDASGKVNTRGTLAMAKLGGDPNSATSQFFFNASDNSSNLDNQNGGFTTFAQVLGNGMATIDEIMGLQRVNAGGALSELPIVELSPDQTELLERNLIYVRSAQAINVPVLTFQASSTASTIVGVSVLGNTLTLVPAIGNPGTATITVRATDILGATTTVSFTVDTRPPRDISAGGPYSITEGQTLQLSGSAGNLGTANTTFGWDLNDDGIFTDATGLTVSVGASTLAALGLSDGPRTFGARLRATPAGGSAITSGAAVVTLSNAPPSGTFTVPASATEGQPFTVTLGGTDPSTVDAQQLRYSLDINNDGTFDVTNATSGSFTVTAPDGPATLSLRARVIDKDGAFVDFVRQVSVNNAAPTGVFDIPASVPEGRELTITLVGSDPGTVDAASLRYDLDINNDGSWDLTNSTTGVFVIPGRDGTSTLAFRGRVTDKDGSANVYQRQVTITNVAPTAQISAPGGSAVVTSTVTFSGQATDPSAADQAAGFRFAWTVVNVASNQTVATANTPTLTFTPQVVGQYRATLRITDRDNAESEAVVRDLVVVPPADSVAPSATLVPVPTITAAASFVEVTVAYSDDVGINTSTLVNSNLDLTDPTGLVRTGTFLRSTVGGGGVGSGGGQAVLATYRIDAGTTPFATGDHTLALRGGTVQDTGGNPLASLTASVVVTASIAAPGSADIRIGSGAGISNIVISGKRIDFNDLLTLTDNSTLAVGFDSDDRLVLVKLTPAGQLDTTFATSGVRSISMPFGFSPGNVQFDSDAGDRLLITGTTLGTPATPTLLRLDADGNRAPGFGLNGIFTPGGLANSETFSAARTLPDGRVVVAGSRIVNGARQLFVARFLSTGLLDARFGTKGIYSRTAAAGDAVTFLSVTSAQAVNVAGTAANQPMLLRLSSAGRLTAGTVAPFQASAVSDDSTGRIQRVELDPQGRFVATVVTGENPQSLSYALVRISSNFRLDTVFRASSARPGVPLAPPLTLATPNSPTVATTPGLPLFSRRPDGAILTLTSESSASLGTLATAQFFREEVNDLAITGTTGPTAAVKPNANLSLRFTLASLGSLPITSRFSTRLVLSADGILGNSDDIVLRAQDLTLTRFASGSSRALSISGKVPANQPAGAYKLFLVIVPPAAIDETAANNSRSLDLNIVT
jgi:cyclophilin family peptidyl-prolyl cis-trans isomerase